MLAIKYALESSQKASEVSYSDQTDASLSPLFTAPFVPQHWPPRVSRIGKLASRPGRPDMGRCLSFEHVVS